MHFNLHKTFSTPHGGGGPGSGPIAVRSELAEFLPTPHVTKEGDIYKFHTPKNSCGKVKGFNGQFGMHVRALTYMLSHGNDGLQKVAEDAVLSANYILAKLKNYYHIPFEGNCMHECLLTDKLQKTNKKKLFVGIFLFIIWYGFNFTFNFFVFSYRLQNRLIY
jgi:glycine dehydrogenase subunit 2